MKRIILAVAIVGLVFALTSPAMGRKFSFDLAKGSILFNYTITGTYNPLHLQISLANGYAETHISSEGYNSNTSMEGTGDLSLSQIAATYAIVLEAEVDGNISSTTTTPEGIAASLNFTGEGGVDKEIANDLDPNYADIEIDTGIYVGAQEGRLIVEDSTSNPDLATIMSQKLPLARREARGIISTFGKGRASYALDNTIAHNSTPWRSSGVAGGGGTVIENSISANNLSPAALFQLSLHGLKYKGYLKNSAVYVRVYLSNNGVQIRDLDVNITIVGPTAGGRGNVVLYDVLPYDYGQECYFYHIDEENWLVDIEDLRRSAYELYIDVGRMQTIRLPIAVIEDKQVIPRRVSD